MENNHILKRRQNVTKKKRIKQNNQNLKFKHSKLKDITNRLQG